MGTWIGIGLSHVFGGSKFLSEVKAYFTRVLTDLGIIVDKTTTNNVYKFLKTEGLDTDTKLLWFGDAGIKTRSTTVSSTPLTFISRGYSIQLPANDLTQTTELNQPYLSGNIAPNERYALKNPSTAIRVINHPQIAFTNAQRWTTTICARWDGTINTISALFGKNTTVSAIRIENTTVGNVFAVTNESGTTVNGTISTAKLIGKNIPITFVGDLTSVKIYVEGVLFDTITISSEFNFVSLLRGLSAANTEFTGIVQFYRIQSGAMTAPQVAAEHAMLRSIYPEIESVQIGTQTWATSNLEMVATPMGNVIQEVKPNSNEEKITDIRDREFSEDTGWWIKGVGWSITNGVARVVGENTYLQTQSVLTSSKFIKIVVNITELTGEPVFSSNWTFLENYVTVRNLGIRTLYLRAGKGQLSILCPVGSSITIDSISIEEIGWANATELYNGVYAQTSGTAQQKEYAALKAAAMWCYYNNDPTVGAVYGKLYNWYAVRLLQWDIDLYNAANPSTPWGWRVPTSADASSLASLSAHDLRMTGSGYWAQNDLATNSTGLSVLGAGYRSGTTGVTDALRNPITGFWLLNNSYLSVTANDTLVRINGGLVIDPPWGYSIRLIKDE